VAPHVEPGATPLRRTLPIALFVTIGALIALDLVTDAREGTSVGHLLVEATVLALALAGAGVLGGAALRERRAMARALVSATTEARAWQGEAARWRSEASSALQGLGEAIERQFDRWQLSAAEREVAMLLLKGLSLQEVAEVRQTSERTTRQQAQAVYKKAGLAGRAELSAFFLEDLLPGQSPPG
jgi:DNA-binding CsgD family transcriptional regulator